MSNTKQLRTPLLVAHRGFMEKYPENTWPAVYAALEAGADFIEFDLQMNADLEFIVIHDANFQRTSGVQRSVFDAGTEQCRQISVHHPSRFAASFKPLSISTLAEMLALITQFPKASALVEIKGESIKRWGLERVMDALLGQLEAFQTQCVLISFSVAAIEYTQRHSALKTGWVLEEYDEAHRAQAAILTPDYLMTDYQLIPAGKPPWPEFKRWMLYDIVDTDIALAYSEMGVELIETANIGKLKQFFSALGG